jgi:hypothetical protein
MKFTLEALITIAIVIVCLAVVLAKYLPYIIIGAIAYGIYRHYHPKPPKESKHGSESTERHYSSRHHRFQ